MKIGFARDVGLDKAQLEVQIRELEHAGAAKIFSCSGDMPAAEPTLKSLLDFAREDDLIIVTSLDRIASTVRHLVDIQEILERKKIDFLVLDIGLDTRSETGKAMMGFLPRLCDMRQNVTREAQQIGIAAAKDAGLYKGRKPTARAKTAEVLNAYRLGRTISQIAVELGMGRASVYRILEANGLWATRA
jgi:DNA invertase Pin-like site-specific DNA recombinase